MIVFYMTVYKLYIYAVFFMSKTSSFSIAYSWERKCMFGIALWKKKSF